MIVHFNKITPENRSLIRSIESKAHVSYIRYLLLKRWSFERIRRELMRLGLAWNEKEDFEIYFQEVLFPVIKKHKLGKYYKKYSRELVDAPLTFSETFGNSEKDRVAFADLLNFMEVAQFFAEEIVEHYGTPANIPNHPSTGDPIIPQEKPIDLVEILQNPRRYVIEHLLIEGYSPKQIELHLYQRYDMEVTSDEIKAYAKSFFNVKRQDVQRLLDTLQDEKDLLADRLLEVKNRPKSDFSVGERFEIISKMSEKNDELTKLINKLSSVHINSSYNAAVLEVTDMREMFSDVMTRAHKRFRDLDERTEDEIVGPLNSIVTMMAKATDKIMSIDDTLNQTSNKSVNEEMLEVIMPTLDRIEQEEREAHFSYRQMNKKSKEPDEDDVYEDDEILGFE